MAGQIVELAIRIQVDRLGANRYCSMELAHILAVVVDRQGSDLNKQVAPFLVELAHRVREHSCYALIEL